MSSAIEVRPVAGRGELKAFVRFPWRVYRGDPHWVPPLLSAAARTFDPRHNAFFEHGDIRPYLAWRGGEPVGRIAAITNRLHNERYNDRVGFWGYFESLPEAEVVAALLDHAADDLRERGLTEMWGPFNPSINGECGLLVEGFDEPPALLMPYNPPAYPELVERAGHRKLKDLYAYELLYAQVDTDQETRRRMERIEAAVRRRHPEITFRTIDMGNYEAEVLALGRLFNAAREGNWGFVPATDAEMLQTAREMKLILEPRCIILAEIEGKPAGCVMGLPDVNPLLRKLDGRLLPFGWARLLWGKRKLSRMRIFGAAVLPAHRHLGITPILFLHYIRNGTRRGYFAGELSWVAEDNVRSVQTLEAAFQPRLYKRYRVYGKTL